MGEKLGKIARGNSDGYCEEGDGNAEALRLDSTNTFLQRRCTLASLRPKSEKP